MQGIPHADGQLGLQSVRPMRSHLFLLRLLVVAFFAQGLEVVKIVGASLAEWYNVVNLCVYERIVARPATSFLPLQDGIVEFPAPLHTSSYCLAEDHLLC